MRLPTRTLGVACVAATLALVAPGPVAAQEDGVTLDNDAPAAQEYALPHQQARRDAEGSGKTSSTQGSRDAKPFGEGVSDDNASGRSPTGGSSGGSSTGDSSSGSSGDDDDQAGDATPAPLGDDEASSAARESGEDAESVNVSGGIGSTTALLGGAAFVLLAGGIGGFALRSVRGRDDA